MSGFLQLLSTDSLAFDYFVFFQLPTLWLIAHLLYLGRHKQLKVKLLFFLLIDLRERERKWGDMVQ